MAKLADSFLSAYGKLAVGDPQGREEANQFLLQLMHMPEAWQVAKTLLSSLNQQERFLGAQLLYHKSQSTATTLSSSQLAQVTSYTFNELHRQCLPEFCSKQVLYMLEKASAVCCMYLQKHKPQLLSIIVDFMKKSHQKMVVGATLLGEIPEEIKKLSNSSVSTELKSQFLHKKEEISVVLAALVVQLREVPTKAQTALQCIRNWVELGIPLADNPPFFHAVMSTYLLSQLCFERCCQTLVEDFKNITRLGGKQPVQLTANQQQSFIGLIELISISAQKILQESAIRVHFAEMLEQFMQVFSPTLVSIQNDMGKYLLELLLRILQHDDMDTSQYAVQFWTGFYSLVRKGNKGIGSLMFIDYYNRVYQLARYKSNLSRRPSNEETESSIETELMEVAGSGQKGRMTFKEYRVFFVDLFQTIYKVFTQEQGTQQGTARYFAPVFELLRTPLLNKLAENQVQMALFLTKAVNELCLQQGKQSVSAVLDCLPSLKGQEVHRQALKLVVGCCRQIANCPILLSKLSGYIIHSIADSTISSYASYAFISLVECISKHSMEELAVSLLQISFSPIIESLSDESMTKFVAGHVDFIQAFDSSSLRALYLSRFLDEMVRTMDQSIKNPGQKRIQNNLLRLSVVVETLDQTHSKALDLIVHPFLHKVIRYIELVLTSCGGMTYSQNNCIGLATKTLKSTVRLLSNNSSTPTLINVLSVSMKLLAASLSENYNLMSILSCVLQYHSKRTALLDDWLQHYFQQFVGFVLEGIRTCSKLNPDLLKNFFIVIQKVIVYLPEVLTNCAHKPAIEEVCLKSFELGDVHLAKQLLIFIEVYIDSVATPAQIERFIPMVIGMSFCSLPHLNVASFGTLGNLLKVYCKYVFPPNIENYLTSCKWMSCVKQEEIKIIAKVLEQSIKAHNPKTVKGVLSLVASIGKGNPRHEIFQSIKRMYDTWYEQQVASD